jgi:uncharacterized FlgJ-related protein
MGITQLNVAIAGDEKGYYTSKARAKDTNNLWGPWSELEGIIPKSL